MTELVALDPHLFGPDHACFGCSPDHPIGFRLRFFLEGEAVVTRFTPDDRYQGPPGVMHGGLVATLADEIAAWSVIGLRRRFGFTGAIEARLKKPVRIGEEVVGRGRITRDTPRIVDIEVELMQADVQCFTGTFTFALLDRAAAERLLGKALPASWEPFAR
jgi:acyl-coenzyme A thioesterase PaaI-like protein